MTDVHGKAVAKKAKFGEHVVKTGLHTRRHVTRLTFCCVLQEVKRACCISYSWARMASQPGTRLECTGAVKVSFHLQHRLHACALQMDKSNTKLECAPHPGD